jgi:hypothetical protein
MRALFEPHNVTLTDKETVLELNDCTIETFPSNHLDAYRALDNPKFIFIDEADFFRKSEQEDVRHVLLIIHTQQARSRSPTCSILLFYMSIFCI